MQMTTWCLVQGIGWAITAATLSVTVLAEETRELSSQALTLSAPAVSTQLQQLLERRDFGGRQVEIADFQGRTISRDAQSPERYAQPTLPTLTTTRSVSQLIVRPAGTVTVRLSSEPIDLPGGVAVTRFNDADSAESEGWFQPTLEASPVPAVWDNTLGRYRMRLSLGLRGDNLPAGATLQQPVTVQFGFRGLNADPFEAVMLEQTGIANEKHLEFLFLPTTEQPVLELRSAITDIDYPIEAMPRIALRPVNDSMVGLGLGETLVRVVRLQPDGTEANVLNNLRATVEVTAGGAIPEPSELTFRDGDTRFMLRSSGLEDVTVRVTAGAHSDSITIPQRFPTMPVLAALIGGAVGGFSRRFSRNASGGTGLARIAEGLAVAIIAYVAGVLGVGYLGLPVAVVSTEAGAFLTGALTGFAGVTVIELLSKRLAPGSKPG